MPGRPLSAIHHVALNVHDVERSERWYTDVLGFVRLVAYPQPGFKRVVLRHPEGSFTLGLSRHDDPEGEQPFDERRTGLDHLALQVEDAAALEGWIAWFDAHRVVHSEIKPGAVPGAFLVAFRDPDNIQLELFAPPH